MQVKGQVQVRTLGLRQEEDGPQGHDEHHAGEEQEHAVCTAATSAYNVLAGWLQQQGSRGLTVHGAQHGQEALSDLQPSMHQCLESI